MTYHSRRSARNLPRARSAAILVAALLAHAFLPAAPAAAPASVQREIAAAEGWDLLLRRHVREDRVDYDGFARDHAILRRYLEGLGGPIPALGRNDEITLWINAYNAATIDLIVRERAARRGRLRSIKDIPSPWSRPKWRIAGADRSLDEIEHEILRKRFREPRIHFALVCASRSCPALRPTAYRSRFLDAQLDSAAREFLLDSTRNRFDPAEGRVRISKIFDWYGGDFAGMARDSVLVRLYGPETGAVLAYAARFLPATTSSALRARKYRVEFLPYDWSLNSARTAE